MTISIEILIFGLIAGIIGFIAIYYLYDLFIIINKALHNETPIRIIRIIYWILFISTSFEIITLIIMLISSNSTTDTINTLIFILIQSLMVNLACASRIFIKKCNPDSIKPINK